MPTTSQFGYAPEYSGVTPEGLAEGAKNVGLTTVVTASGALEGATQITPAIVLSGLVLHDPQGDVNAQLPNAADLAAALGVATVSGRSVRFIHRNTADAAETITVTAGTGVTISGTATIAQNYSKEWLLVFDSPTTYTAYSVGTQIF